jgi:hypothetical protein
MPIITLPDGSEKSFDQAISVFEVAKLPYLPTLKTGSNALFQYGCQ